jgi:outer membrane murein-binding lipoprotein Lpp
MPNEGGADSYWRSMMTTKKLLLWLSIATAIGSIIGFALGAAYQAGCVTTTVSQVSDATRELYTDVKEIKVDIETLKVDSATTKQSVADIKEYLMPKKPLAENNNGR